MAFTLYKIDLNFQPQLFTPQNSKNVHCSPNFSPNCLIHLSFSPYEFPCMLPNIDTIPIPKCLKFESHINFLQYYSKKHHFFPIYTVTISPYKYHTFTAQLHIPFSLSTKDKHIIYYIHGWETPILPFCFPVPFLGLFYGILYHTSSHFECSKL